MENVKLQKPSKSFNPLQPIYTAFNKNQQLLGFNAAIIAVNIDTIIRAIVQKENIQNIVNIRLILPSIQNEILQMIDCGIEYFETQMLSNSLLEDYYFFIYKVDYSYIPEEYRRNIKTNALVTSFSDMLVSNISILEEIENTINSRLYYLRSNIHIVQAINTYGIVNKFNNIFNLKLLKPNDLEFDVKLVFISHYPPDYHINNVVKYLIIDFYTGNIWTKNTLSTKLFKQDYLVFNKLTHAIFGDKHILRPTIPTSYRRKLDNMIQSSNRVWSNDEIFNYLTQHCPSKHVNNLSKVIDIL